MKHKHIILLLLTLSWPESLLLGAPIQVTHVTSKGFTLGHKKISYPSTSIIQNTYDWTLSEFKTLPFILSLTRHKEEIKAEKIATYYTQLNEKKSKFELFKVTIDQTPYLIYGSIPTGELFIAYAKDVQETIASSKYALSKDPIAWSAKNNIIIHAIEQRSCLGYTKKQKKEWIFIHATSDITIATFCKKDNHWNFKLKNNHEDSMASFPIPNDALIIMSALIQRYQQFYKGTQQDILYGLGLGSIITLGCFLKSHFTGIQ